MNSSLSSSMIADDDLCCNENDEVISTSSSSKRHRRQLQHDNRLPNIIIFTVSLINCNRCERRTKFSVDIPLLSYSFLVRLINRTLHLRSNFTIVTKESSALKCAMVVADDFDLDGCIMNMFDDTADEKHKQSVPLEFVVYQYPRTKEQIECDSDGWCDLEDHCRTLNENNNDKFELLHIEHDSIIVTVKATDQRQETFLQKATGWLHGSVHSSENQALSKKEFFQMLDPTTGRLLDEPAFRQRVFDTGCEESIRKVVWCYLLRVFNESMTSADRVEHTGKAKERYNEMKQAWQNRFERQDSEIIVLDNQIQKDVRRTDRSVKFFDDKENLSCQKLYNILMTYSVYHPEPGYVQGMNDMAAPILFVIRDEPLAYSCFCALMRHMSPLFQSNGTAMARRLDLLRKTLRAIDGELGKKIEQCDISKLMFAYRWLLLDCKREFPFKDIFRVLETLWASLPIDRFESNSHHSSFDSDRDDSSAQYRSSLLTSSLSNTILSSRSSSPTALEDTQSQYSSLDGGDSGYRDDQTPPVTDFVQRSLQSDFAIYFNARPDSNVNSPIALDQWLTHFSSIDDDEHSSDMFTIFLCVAIVQQNRSTIMQISLVNHDNDDHIGSFFTRLVRQHDARQALQVARNYHRQYVLFQMRVKQLLLTEN